MKKAANYIKQDNESFAVAAKKERNVFSCLIEGVCKLFQEEKKAYKNFLFSRECEKKHIKENECRDSCHAHCNEEGNFFQISCYD